MAAFKHGEIPSEEPFKAHLGPLQVAQSIQSALDATWHSLSAADKNVDALRRSVLAELARVETWWMNLPDRRADLIVRASQIAFQPPKTAANAKPDESTIQQMIRWLPAHELAQALFWAWLLQPEDARDPGRTVELVRGILDREFRDAAEDIAAFGWK